MISRSSYVCIVPQKPTTMKYSVKQVIAILELSRKQLYDAQVINLPTAPTPKSPICRPRYQVMYILTCASAMTMSQSPHPAILIPEIIEEIFDKPRPHTEEESISGESRVALARAAHVCRAFREPATRSLWRAIPGIEPVLHSLVSVSLLSVSRTPLTGLASVYIDAAVPTSRTKVNRSYTVAVSAIPSLLGIRAYIC